MIRLVRNAKSKRKFISSTAMPTGLVSVSVQPLQSQELDPETVIYAANLVPICYPSAVCAQSPTHLKQEELGHREKALEMPNNATNLNPMCVQQSSSLQEKEAIIK